MGLQCTPTSPCLFKGTLIKGQPPIFLGVEFHWVKHSDDNLSVTLTQQSFAESLIDSFGYLHMNTSLFTIPYCTGLSIDSIECQEFPSDQNDLLCLQ
jgi:hypothetical protein